MKEKMFLLQSLLLLSLGAFSQNHSIIKEFPDSDRANMIVTYWSWNGTLYPDEAKRQIDLMIDKGIFGAFLHTRAGIDNGKTPLKSVKGRVEHRDYILFDDSDILNVMQK